MNAARKNYHVSEDWHPADVVAALKKKGSSLAAIGRKHHLARQGLSVLWHRHWPKLQAIVAKEIGLEPWEIWPTRYATDGTPKTGRFMKERIAGRTLGRNA